MAQQLRNRQGYGDTGTGTSTSSMQRIDQCQPGALQFPGTPGTPGVPGYSDGDGDGDGDYYNGDGDVPGYYNGDGDALARPVIRHDFSASAHEGLRPAAIREVSASGSALMASITYASELCDQHERESLRHQLLGFGAATAMQFAPPDMASPGQQQRGTHVLLPPRGTADVGIAPDGRTVSAALALTSEAPFQPFQGSSAAGSLYGLSSLPTGLDEWDANPLDSVLGQNHAVQWGNMSSLQTPLDSAAIIPPQLDFSSMMPDPDFDSSQPFADGQASLQFGNSAIAPYNAQQQVYVGPESVYTGVEQSARFPFAGFDPFLDLQLPSELGYVADLPEQRCENFEAGLDNVNFIEEKFGDNSSDQRDPLIDKKGVRKRKLEPAVRAKIALMRKTKACMRCRLQRIRCDTKTPCSRCLNLTLDRMICFRGPLSSYASLLYREPLEILHSEANVKKLICQTVGRFTKNVFVVAVTSGKSYPAMPFNVREFSPTRDSKALEYLIIDPTEREPHTRLCPSYAPPIILCGHDIFGQVVDQVTHHVRHILDVERNPGETQQYNGDIAVLPFQLFEAVNEYRRNCVAGGEANKHLHDAATLHTLQSIIAHLVALTEESVNTTLSRITKPEVLLFARTVTSKIVDAQIASVVHQLLREKVHDLLESLEKILLERERTIPDWLDAFSIVLVLCMFAETVQARLEGIIVTEIPVSPEARASYWRDLDEGLHAPCVRLFHEHFKSEKSGRKGLNLLRDGLRLSDGLEVTQAMVDFVAKVRRITEEHREDMLLRKRHPDLGQNKDGLRGYMELRRRNSGRLVAKFLLSF